MDNSNYTHMEKNCSPLVTDTFYKQVPHTSQQNQTPTFTTDAGLWAHN